MPYPLLLLLHHTTINQSHEGYWYCLFRWKHMTIRAHPYLQVSTQKKGVPKQCPWGAIATNSALFRGVLFSLNNHVCQNSKTAPLHWWGNKKGTEIALLGGAKLRTAPRVLFWHPFFKNPSLTIHRIIL